jgi:hypothetical protein
MVDKEEAQELAQELVKEFVTAAGARDMRDVGNVLMLLASVVGISLVHAVGHADAVSRLQGTVDFITNNPKGREDPADEPPPGAPPRAGYH